MGILQVELFGGVRVTRNAWVTEIQLTRENQGLLAYLLIQRQRVHSREILADLFWGDFSPTRARGSLNTALWKLKKVLEPKGVPSGTYLKNSHSGEIGFNLESPYWLDVQVFEDHVNQVLRQPFETVDEPAATELEKVLRLYKGELLEGIYKDWALRERERLRGLYVKGLIYLMHYHGFHQAFPAAIDYGQQVLDLDPLREEIHREIMRFYLENGQRTLALRQYETCRSTLQKELGIPPMEDVRMLYAQIIAACKTTDPVAMSSVHGTNVGEVLRQLQAATQSLDLAKEQIQHAYRLISAHADQSKSPRAKRPTQKR